MGIFRTIASTLILVVFIYISHQLTRFTDLAWHWQTLLVSFLALLFTMVIGTFLYLFKERSIEHSPWKDRLLNSSLNAMAYINFLVSLVILRDLFAFADHLVTTTAYTNLYSSQATAALMGAPLVLMTLGNLVIKMGPRIKTMSFSFTNLPSEFDGLRILHITDLHIGSSLPSSFVEKLVARIVQVNPDLIVFTGDILDGFIEKHQKDVNMLKQLQPPHGVFFVPGNHEYYWDAPKGLQAFRDLGFHVLINQTAQISRGSATLQIAGIPDPAATHFQQEAPDLVRLQQLLSPNSFKILLSHQPSVAPKSTKLGIDLQLSGHTHGGQFFPWNWLIVFFEKYSKGHYHLGNMQLYVNQGTGYWGPQLRLGTYCELAEIILRKARKKE